jgi:serine protease Do
MKKIIATLLFAALPLALAAQRATTAPRAERNFEVMAPDGSGAWMGVGVDDVTSENAAKLKLKEERGAHVSTVSPGGPAEKAGLKENDVILEFNGQRVDSVEQFRRLIRETPAGRTVKVVASRDGVPMTFQVKLGDRPGTTFYRNDGNNWVVAMPPMPPMPAMPAQPPSTGRTPRAAPRIEVFPDMEHFGFMFDGAPRLGIEGDVVGKQLGEFFGVPSGEGVLVRAVTAGSAAEKAGIKAGDVITKVDGESVKDIGDLRGAIRDRRNKSSYTVTLVRNKKEMSVTVKNEKPEAPSGDRV